MEGNSKIGDTAGADGENSIDVLDNLAPNTWVGYGFNLIAVPCGPGKPGCELGFHPQVQGTLEILKFSKISKALDRGSSEQDLPLRTARYLQTVINSSDGRSVIHNEPGLWVHVPKNPQSPSDVFVRLAVTPHGDSILAQSTSFARASLPLTIGSVNAFPFSFKNGIADIPPLINGESPDELKGEYIEQYSKMHWPSELERSGLDPAKTIKDPTEALRKAIEGQDMTDAYMIEISTKLGTQFGIEKILKNLPERMQHGGSALDSVQTAGIRNIPFVNSQADAVLMDAVFWIEMMADSTPENPHFQLQYVQRVILDFPVDKQRVHWPHISVATLKNVA